MAGGVIVLLGMNRGDQDLTGIFCGTGMHGGRIFIRGSIPPEKLGKEVKVVDLTEEDKHLLTQILEEYKADLSITEKFALSEFKMLIPGSKRPYGRMYAY